MTTISKSLLAFAVVGAIAGLTAFFGLSPFGKQIITQTFGSPSGATFNSAKFAAIAVNLANPGANATSSSVLNNSSSDYYVSTIKVGCEGVGSSNTAYSGSGLAALTMFAATSSTAAPANNTFNTNKVGGGNITIGTSTTVFAVASSTTSQQSTGLPNGNNGALYVVWPAGTYMTFTTNATNTAVCTFGVDYFSA